MPGIDYYSRLRALMLPGGLKGSVQAVVDKDTEANLTCDSGLDVSHDEQPP